MELCRVKYAIVYVPCLNSENIWNKNDKKLTFPFWLMVVWQETAIKDGSWT